MALRTLGTTSTTVLRCLPAWSAVLLPADVAAVGDAIIDDRMIAAILGGYGPGATAVIGTSATHTNTTLDTLVRVSGGPLASIMVGDLVLGVGIPLGTFIVAKASQVSVTLSAAATTTAATNVIFARPTSDPEIELATQILTIPNRGRLNVLPGDIVAVDASGWPILVSAAAIGYAGTNWTLT
jgi:hypothetical protein